MVFFVVVYEKLKVRPDIVLHMTTVFGLMPYDRNPVTHWEFEMDSLDHRQGTIVSKLGTYSQIKRSSVLVRSVVVTVRTKA